METKRPPKTLIEAVRYFSDPDVCQAFLVSLRWPDGLTCPACGSKNVLYLANQRRWKCRTKHPKRQFSIKVGSIFEDSPIPLQKWLPVVWQLVNCKNGISSYEVHRGIGVTQKSAWFMLHRIRTAMKTGTFEKMGGSDGGPVEVDESFIGGKARFMNNKTKKKRAKGRGPVGKAIVLGFLDRKKTGKVLVKQVDSRKKKPLQGEVEAHVEKGSEVFTDDLASSRRSTFTTS
jgi:transposase-like protein